MNHYYKTFLLYLLGLLICVSSGTLVLGTDSVKEEILNRLSSEDYLGIPKALLGEPVFTGSQIKYQGVKDGVLSLPFGDRKDEWRFYFDQRVKVDLSGKNEFYLDAVFADPTAAGEAHLYFHSGKGWYSIPGKAMQKLDGKSVRYSFSTGSAVKEDDPAGLNTVDIIRVAFFPRIYINSSVKIEGLYAGRSSVAILFPNFEKTSESTTFVGGTGKLIARAGISAVLLPEESATLDVLRQYKVIIIPIAGSIKEKMVDTLCDYLDQGGFVVAFYTMPEKLMKKMGFSAGTYMPCRPSTVEVAKIEFTKEFLEKFAPGMPKAMEQNSYNITWAKPLENINDPFLQEEKNKPIIAAWWYDIHGKKTQYPAILWSGRGLYYSHVLIGDDPVHKEQFLVSLFGQYDSSINMLLFCKKWQQLHSIGCTQHGDLRAIYKKQTAKIIDSLEKKNWSARQIMSVLDTIDNTIKDKNISAEQLTQFQRFIETLGEIQGELSLEYVQNLKPMKKETRFLWEHSGLGPYPGDWDRAMRELSEAGFNGVISNILFGGGASYNSKLLPLTDRYRQYGDQIEQAVTAAHKYGMELHVWKVNFRAAGAPPEWQAKMAAEGRIQKSYSVKDNEPCWLCPSHPANQDLEVNSMLEIAKNYNVDGIHFDYIRYPDMNHCYCDGCKERFSKYCLEKIGQTVKNWPEDTKKNPEIAKAFVQWRCDQITTIVRRVREEVDKAHLKVLISAAVFSSYPSCRHEIGQDWVYWVKQGYLDLVFPMDYTDSADNFEGMVERQLKATERKIPLYPGIGLLVPSYLSPDKLAAQIEVTRRHKTGGFCLFALSPRSIQETVPVMGKTPFKEKAKTSHSH